MLNCAKLIAVPRTQIKNKSISSGTISIVRRAFIMKIFVISAVYSFIILNYVISQNSYAEIPTKQLKEQVNLNLTITNDEILYCSSFFANYNEEIALFSARHCKMEIENTNDVNGSFTVYTKIKRTNRKATPKFFEYSNKQKIYTSEKGIYTIFNNIRDIGIWSIDKKITKNTKIHSLSKEKLIRDDILTFMGYPGGIGPKYETCKFRGYTLQSSNIFDSAYDQYYVLMPTCVLEQQANLSGYSGGPVMKDKLTIGVLSGDFGNVMTFSDFSDTTPSSMIEIENYLPFDNEVLDYNSKKQYRAKFCLDSKGAVYKGLIANTKDYDGEAIVAPTWYLLTITDLKPDIFGNGPIRIEEVDDSFELKCSNE